MSEELRRKYIELYGVIADVYNHILVNTEEGEKPLKYLHSRGFTKETIEQFHLGYSYKGNLIGFFLKRYGMKLSLGKEFGLLKEFEKGPKYRDFFYGRVMFPIRNEYGEIVAFAGRILPGNTHPAKYLNTPETEYFCKGDIVYNLDLAKETIRKKNVAIIFEGYFDAIAAYQFEIKNAISLMGTALTENQIQKISRYTNRVILCLDGDKAGMENAKRNAEKFLQYGFEVLIAVLTESDPHEYLMAKGKDDFIKNVICKATDYYSFVKYLMGFEKDLTNEVHRLEYVNGILGSLHTATLEQQGKIFLELAKEMGVSTHSIMSVIRSEMYKN